MQRPPSWLVMGLCIAGSFSPLASAQLPSSNEIKSFGRRIVGGEPTTIEEHPWQTAVIVTRDNNLLLCGGSIIAQTWMLSAAHCFDSGNSKQVKIKSGSTDIKRQGIWKTVDKIVVHERYNPANHSNDIALIKSNATSAGRVIPIADAKAVVPVNEPLEVTGWGTTTDKGETLSDTLMRATVLYVDNDTCNEPASYNNKISPEMMCAGHRDGGIDACQGDSGGPLVWKTPDGPILVGVVSFGEGCARKLKYGVYTRLSSYRDWITRTVAAN